MALIRKTVRERLIAAGIPEDKVGAEVDYIFEGHSATVDSLKEERDNYKTEAEKVPDLQKQLQTANNSIKDGEGWKDKYDKLFAEQTTAKKRSALETALKEAKANPAVIGLMLKGADFESIEIGEDGKLKDSEAAIKPFREAYADLFGKEEEKGNPQPNPLGNPNPKPQKQQPANLRDALRQNYNVKE